MVFLGIHNIPLVGLERLTPKVSLASASLSSIVSTVKLLTTSPGAKVIVPLVAT
jgi:hypothetical protein